MCFLDGDTKPDQSCSSFYTVQVLHKCVTVAHVEHQVLGVFLLRTFRHSPPLLSLRISKCQHTFPHPFLISAPFSPAELCTKKIIKLFYFYIYMRMVSFMWVLLYIFFLFSFPVYMLFKVDGLLYTTHHYNGNKSRTHS